MVGKSGWILLHARKGWLAMTRVRKAGDAAFPSVTERGLSMRDYFAAQALTALMRNHPGRDINTNVGDAYRIADAMVNERDN
jgi:hypothetical protein